MKEQHSYILQVVNCLREQIFAGSSFHMLAFDQENPKIGTSQVFPTTYMVQSSCNIV